MNTGRPFGILFLASVLIFGIPEETLSQFVINVQGPSPNLIITTGTPAGGPTPVVNTGSRLRYRRWLVPAKVTVTTVCPGQSFNLSVVATGATIGTPAPEVNLITGMPAMDFITGILPGSLIQGVATLRYTASSTYQQGHSMDFGNDVHVVTYTIVAQ